MVHSILWRLSASVIAAVLTPDPARKTKPTYHRKLWQVHNSVTAVKWFCREWIGVNPPYAIVLRVSKDQPGVQCGMPL
jgi:hypothetical protein